MKFSNEQLAYTAGLMDGEGSIVICIHKPSKKNKCKSPSHWLQIGISNNDKEIMNWLKELFGGCISKGSIKKGKTLNWTWKIYSNQGCEFLKLILPYIIIKKRQIKLAVEFQEKRCRFYRCKAPTLEELLERDWYKKEISKLSPKRWLPNSRQKLCAVRI